MKRFVISVLSVSVFFLGLGNLIDSASAQFKTDDKATELIGLARTAIGGGSNLRDVRSMTIVGSSTHFFEKDGITRNELGNVEINLELPNRFSKMIKVGNPDGAAGGGEIHKEMDVVIMKKDGDSADFSGDHPADGKGVFVIKKGDGNVEWVSKDDSETKTGGEKIIVRKKGGGDSSVWNTDGNKRIIIEKDDSSSGPHTGTRSNELLRTTIGLLMIAPEGLDVRYKFEGTGTVDGYPANIIGVESHGSAFKLFLDAATNMPRMISFAGPKAIFFHKAGEGDVSKEEMIHMKKQSAESLEHQIRFSDFRGVEGLLLPHRWTETVNGKQSQIIDITSYEINPANIGDKFKGQKVFVRKMKPESN